MKISIASIIPDQWIVSKNNSLLHISYKNKKGSQPLPFDTYSVIKIDETFIEGIALFLGDGNFGQAKKYHTSFSSRDIDLALFMLNFFIKYFNINKKQISFFIYHNPNNKIDPLFFKNKLNINKLIIKPSKRYKNPSITLQINSVVFRKLFDLTIKFILNQELPLSLKNAFLRGLFAAEGNIGIKRKEGYINQITFNLSSDEQWLIRIITKYLGINKISYRINLRNEKHSIELIIQNWKNYSKLWDIDLFKLCSRKDLDFKEIMFKTNIFCNLNSPFRKELFYSLNLNQREIAKLLNSWQGNVSKTIQGKHLLRIEQLILLSKYKDIEEIKKNITSLRFGFNTNLCPSKRLLDFLFDLKLNRAIPYS